MAAENTTGMTSFEDILNEFPEENVAEMLDDTPVEPESEQDNELEEPEVVSENTDDETTLKFTPFSEEPVAPTKSRTQERIAKLKEKLAEAQSNDDLDAQKAIMSDISNIVTLLDTETQLGSVDVAFSKSFGAKHQPKDVFRSKEWREFTAGTKYGIVRSDIYSQAVASNNVDAISEIFAEFIETVSNASNKNQSRKPPITPRSNTSAGNAAKPVLSKAQEVIFREYDEAVDSLLKGLIDTKKFNEIETEYMKTIAT